MPFCLDCPKYKDCKEICPEVENILPKPRSGGHKKELTFPTNLMDKILLNDHSKGRRKKSVKYNDNYEVD